MILASAAGPFPLPSSLPPFLLTSPRLSTILGRTALPLLLLLQTRTGILAGSKYRGTDKPRDRNPVM